MRKRHSTKAEPGSESETQAEREDRRPRGGRGRHIIRMLSLVAWAALLGIVYSVAARTPSVSNIVVAGGLSLMFVLVNLQILLARWLRHRQFRRLTNKLYGSAYLSDLQNLPNRNYLLAELRREMPRARSAHEPFVLIQISLDEIETIRARRGGEFADRAVVALADLLKRLTRSSDFLAHLGGAGFCVMLVECTREQSWTYLKRVPGIIPVSDGFRMLDVPVTARIHEYDLESLYATDVLREVEDAKPMRRKEEPRLDAIAA
ncbi:MAG: diguanylate cyclase [Dehalococcoidia bacterium]|nr:diguanylate cyclase [Dehalococcoidia bacterium]